MPQKAEESHLEYRARQQEPLLPGPHLENRILELEEQMRRVIDACCRHHAGLCRDLEGPKTEGETDAK